MKRVLKRTMAISLVFMILFLSIPMAQAAEIGATLDEAVSQNEQKKSLAFDELFVSEWGRLADGTDGSYVGIPSQAFESGQTFESVKVDEEKKMTDAEGTEIGTYSNDITGAVSEEELARPRMLIRKTSAPDKTDKAGDPVGAGQEIEINDFRAVLRSGAVRTENGDMVWTATDNNTSHTFTYRVYYSFSGVGDYEADQIHITIPKSVLRDRNGNLSDSFEMAMPSYDTEGLTEDNLFVYRVEGDNIVIFNRLECSAAESGFFEVSYTTTKPIIEYADYMAASSVTANPNPKRRLR